MLTHVVFFKLVDPSPASAAEVRERMLQMREHIPQLRHLEAGVDVVRSERSWDVCLLARFDGRADLDAYLAHPAHVAFAAWLAPRRERSCVVDYDSP
jgi:hypothetical protein